MHASRTRPRRRRKGQDPTNIVFLLYPGFTALDAIGPYEVLSRIPEARVRFVAAQPGPIPVDTHGVSSQLTVGADAGFGEVHAADVLLIPGGSTGTMRAMDDQATIRWVRAIHATTRYTVSVCTGAYLLGAAGLLDGLTVTTHWASADDIGPRYGATYRPERFVRQGKIVTAAGVSAGIDVALWLTGELAGEEMAQAAQLVIEYDPDAFRHRFRAKGDARDRRPFASGAAPVHAIKLRGEPRRASPVVRAGAARPIGLPASVKKRST